ncbi:MAG: sigma 54-interacting transcriptional regulator [Syntrophomonadaceae bacterium]|nr:sigma 54-interacting transcriptional regulator [Syntrophomonadaceae bacterium]
MNMNQKHLHYESTLAKLVPFHDNTAFRLFLEKVPVLIYVYQGDKVIYVNPAVEKTLGYSFDEMVQFNFWDICHEDYKDLIRQRGHARLRGEDVPTNYEIKILKKNGEAIWVDVFFALTEFSGFPTTIVGAYDITEKKELQERLQQAHDELESRVEERTHELITVNQELTLLNENLNNIIQNMSDGVMIVDNLGNIQVLNPVMKEIGGTLLEQIRQKIGKDARTNKSSFIYQMLHERIPFKDEEIILSTSRGSVHFLASGTPIEKNNSSTKQGVIIIRPIKEVHRLVNRFAGSQARYTFNDIITRNPKMLDLISEAKRAAQGTSNIVIQGESGTGKEMFAQAIHLESNRRNGPFIAVNCGAIPRDLIGSELFGYVEGAFTGAKKEGNPGKFELASGGTLFLDEIGDMPFEQQVALLRVIHEKTVTRIGGYREIPVDVRIICATNKDLEEEMKKGNFRADLYYRLNVISLKIPPLRERPEDIEPLFKYFIQKKVSLPNEEYVVPDSILKPLINYSWPGNVRELQNIVERIVNKSHGKYPEPEHLPNELFNNNQLQEILETEQLNQNKMNLFEVRKKHQEMLMEMEKEQIIHLLQKHEGNISKVAKEMGMARSTIYRKMRQYEL